MRLINRFGDEAAPTRNLVTKVVFRHYEAFRRRVGSSIKMGARDLVEVLDSVSCRLRNIVESSGAR